MISEFDCKTLLFKPYYGQPSGFLRQLKIKWFLRLYSPAYPLRRLIPHQPQSDVL